MNRSLLPLLCGDEFSIYRQEFPVKKAILAAIIAGVPKKPIGFDLIVHLHLRGADPIRRTLIGQSSNH
ncbi:MAG: hypothetical protein OJF48_001497 [Afipia sp.]|nr:MAG: hypothetical protein OJF48_001497 [Afipia sp.]